MNALADTSVLRDLVDKLAIQELTARFDHAADERDYDAFRETLADDVTVEMFGQTMTGRDNVVAAAERFEFGVDVEVGLGQTVHLGQLFHLTAGSVIDLDGDEAVQKCMQIVFRQIGREASPKSVAIYTLQYADRLVRTADGWRFRERVLTSYQSTASFDEVMKDLTAAS